MIADILQYLFLIFLGLAGGIAVGGGLVSLLIVFDLIPRLAQLACAFRKAVWFETAVISGAFFWSIADFLDWRVLHLPQAVLAPVGLLDGVFVGMLAAALTEVMNVLPILARRLRIEPYLLALVTAMMLGKVAGSLFDWLVFQWNV
ncbi:stage V sporulation protein AB [Paenibacillus sp. GCM10027626]|uniref:stage V sporulation protein AB n=1 Tax=Paenibacillus sp. GCM10027626 TaxID=3273411 RepID=UPI00363CE475